MENQTQSLEISTTTARTSEPNLKSHVHKPSTLRPRIHHCFLHYIEAPTHQVSTAAYQSRDGPPTTTRRPSTTSNNNSLYNRQLDFTPSLLSQPPTEYVLDATFRRIEARDAARKMLREKMDAIQTKQTTMDDSKAPSVLLVTPKQ